VAQRLRLSIRELLLLTTIVSLVLALLRLTLVDAQPVYLHVFGTLVAPTHDQERPPGSPTNRSGEPWTRIATVQVFSRRPFGFNTPNDRSPAIAIDGKLNSTWDGTYQGRLHFFLDDTNLTYDVADDFDLESDEVNYIDPYYDCFILSRCDDPYVALARAMKRDASRPQGRGR
jgi:hypothetical protein